MKPANPVPCTSSSQLEIRNAEGYISSSKAAAGIGWGSSKCPWLITALPGQQINVTMIDFQPLDLQQKCQQLGFIKDLNNGQEIPICKDVKRIRHLYTSTGTQVKIHINQASSSDENEIFLLHYTGEFCCGILTITIQHVVWAINLHYISFSVVGCTDLLAPENAWHKRDGNTAIIGCSKQNKAWHLMCDGERWQGVVGKL